MRDTPARRLKKRDVERLLEDIDGDPQGAVAHALSVVLDLPIGTSWSALVDAAARTGNWSASRREEVRAGAIAALFDLAAELNERRTIVRDDATG